MFDAFATSFGAYFDLIDIAKKLYTRMAEKAIADKETFTHKLETAAGDDIFKYVLLINVSALEGYVAQTRLQAQSSFRLCRSVSLIGFLLIIAGIGFGFYLSAQQGIAHLDAAYLAAGAGMISQFISAIFFYLYNRTLQQINRFHDRLIAMQQTSMALLASSLVNDPTKRDEAKFKLAQSILPTVPIAADPMIK